MAQVFKSICDSLIMTTAFSSFMFLAMISNTVLGSVIASKYDQFNWKTLFKGIIRNLFILIGIDVLASSLSGMTKLIEIYGILVGEAELLQQVSVYAIVGIIITATYKVYGKQALDKFKSLTDVKDEDLIKINQDKITNERGA